jgi:serine/threonine-protein kinase/endoribonuclease IRE1
MNNLIRVAAAVFFVPWFVDAQQQQRPAVPQRHESRHENLDPDVLHTLEATTVPPRLETPLTSGRRKNTYYEYIKNDASAIATLAPADSAVAAPSSRRSSKATAGLAPPQSARSLEDWEVEDFVLLATVDGKLYARDRKSGQERWSLEVDKPMVETTYHRRNRSASEEGYESITIDDYLWIVEPSRDGSLYVYRPGGPNPGLVNTGLTMKKLVEEMSPYSDEDPAVTYTGEKKTTMIVIDARNGRVLKYFGSTGALVNDESCLNGNDILNKDSEECSTTSTLTIGRTEYTVGINGAKDGRQIATLKFSEWVPNNYDHDLERQYHTTLDNKYIYTSHDGGVIGFDHDRTAADKPGKLFKHKFASPVVRVFDVARPWGSEDNDPNLIILPQPVPPNQIDDEVSAHHRERSIFLNHTEDGSWYAMSGKFYPLAVQGIGQAACEQQEWRQHGPSWDALNDLQLSQALVGLHSVDHVNSERLLTISAPSLHDHRGNNTSTDTSPALLVEPTIVERIRLLPILAVNYLLEFIKNPMLIILLIGILASNQQQVRTWVSRLGHVLGIPHLESPIPTSTSDSVQRSETSEYKSVEVPSVDTPSETPAVKVVEAEAHRVEQAVEKENGEMDKMARVDSLDVPSPEEVQTPGTKKKAYRGRRGGVKHRKGRDRAASQDASHDPKIPPTVEDAVRDAQNMGEQTKLEPDIRTISHNPSEVSGPIIRVGSLVVNTDKLIGTGSNGTMVFEGSFDGREVAVKRMLIQFFDIASQETKLLRESDDHPNGPFYILLVSTSANIYIVIRYFAQQQAAGFLYIALELCPASLADVIEKPTLHRELAQSGEKDLPHVLYQITNGLQHLHSLRIVHRDLKPQNILVTMGKDGRPRLLVSDFGLCKKLEGEQSSFRATTAHAAGTSGWRAPELLLDDDARDGSAVIEASTNGDSSGALVSSDLMPNRRATRAIDIFSLGLVFFYVLTKGSHPFDCGDRYMREVNIRKGNYSLKHLEVLGDYSFEAKDLIGSMLAPDPKLRPTALQIMAHPFFWPAKKRLNFLCDVSDHFEKEVRDPPSLALQELERWAPDTCRGDFLKPLGKEFVDSLGKQRKYTGSKLLDLMRALRNKKNHYEDMSEKLKKDVGPLPDGYLNFWTRKFPNLLITCWNIVYEVQWEETDRFREYYQPAGL